MKTSCELVMERLCVSVREPLNRIFSVDHSEEKRHRRATKGCFFDSSGCVCLLRLYFYHIERLLVSDVIMATEWF